MPTARSGLGKMDAGLLCAVAEVATVFAGVRPGLEFVAAWQGLKTPAVGSHLVSGRLILLDR